MVDAPAPRIVGVRHGQAGPQKVVIIMGTNERAQALFVSYLQPSQQPGPDQVAAAIEDSLLRWGPSGCAAAAAAEYGEHPDTAAARMRWALAVSALIEPLERSNGGWLQCRQQNLVATSRAV
jgi:hypothetical protein